MKRISLGIAMLALSVTIAACGQSDDGDNANKNEDDVINNEEQNTNDQNDENIDNENTNEDTATNNTSSDDMQQRMDELDFMDFELAIEYTNDQKYEADLENDNNRVEAKLEDDLNGVYISGEEAFNEIYPNVQKLTIDQGTSKEDAIKQTLEAFGLDLDYIEFELELKFNDGTKIEFKDKK